MRFTMGQLSHISKHFRPYPLNNLDAKTNVADFFHKAGIQNMKMRGKSFSIRGVMSTDILRGGEGVRL